MRIGSRDIGPAHPPYIIAEIGVNHDGSIDRALELTRAAARAGADAVKLQLFETDRLMSKAAKLAAYQKAAGETDPIAMLRRLELSIDDMARVVTLSHELNIHAIVTVFSVELVEAAERLPWDAYKTASPDLVHRPLLEALSATGKPLIVSTGASTIDEVRSALDWLGLIHARLALLQCVSCYPTPIEHAELGGIPALADLFDGPIGYSDHTDGLSTGLDAVRLGACIIEKHFTHNRSAPGPDHAASLEAREFEIYALNARNGPMLRDAPLAGIDPALTPAVRTALAPPPGVERTKRVLPIEQDVRTVSRQSITTRRALPRGHALTRQDLTFKRPGTGLLPFLLDEALGRPLALDVEADVPLTSEDLA